MVRQTQTLLAHDACFSQCVLRCGLYFYPSSDPQCMPPRGGGPRWEISALGDYRAKLGVVRPLFRGTNVLYL